jgi:hypothetical protein
MGEGNSSWSWSVPFLLRTVAWLHIYCFAALKQNETQPRHIFGAQPLISSLFSPFLSLSLSHPTHLAIFKPQRS